MANDKIYCSKCGAENEVGSSFCKKCGVDLRGASAEKPSNWWYLLPILLGAVFLGWLGGIIGYIVLRVKDEKMAKNILYVGLETFVLGIISIAALPSPPPADTEVPIYYNGGIYDTTPPPVVVTPAVTQTPRPTPTATQPPETKVISDPVVQKAEPYISEIVFEDLEVGKFTRDYEWEYDGYTYGLTFNLYPKAYKFFKDRERTRDYDLFASDYYSKEFIKAITEGLEDYAKENDLTNAEIPYFVISFVQDLPYTSDDVTTGFDEYPRFPYETIYDDGGDCEDTAILASAMLNELGYGVALLQFPEHMAVGVKCTPSAGQSYYTYQGIDFCYLETTGENWDVGKVPPNVKSAKAIVKPIVERPALDIDFTSNYEYNAIDVYVDVKVNVKNLGSKKAENTKIYVALQTSDESKVLDSIESEDLQIEPEGVYQYSVTNLHSPTGHPFRIYVRAFGDNVISDEAVSNWIYWE